MTKFKPAERIVKQLLSELKPIRNYKSRDALSLADYPQQFRTHLK